MLTPFLSSAAASTTPVPLALLVKLLDKELNEIVHGNGLAWGYVSFGSGNDKFFQLCSASVSCQCRHFSNINLCSILYSSNHFLDKSSSLLIIWITEVDHVVKAPPNCWIKQMFMICSRNKKNFFQACYQNFAGVGDNTFNSWAHSIITFFWQLHQIHQGIRQRGGYFP